MLLLLKDFLKCWWANKISAIYMTFFILLAFKSFLTEAWQWDVFGVAFIGVAGITTSRTFRAYCRTKEHIIRFGRIGPRFEKKYTGTGYCTRTGVMLAKKEMVLRS